MRRISLLSLLALSCVVARAPAAPETSPPATLALPDFEAAPRPTQRQLAETADKGMIDSIDAFFLGAADRRVYIQLDRPLVRPGEDVWVKSWNLASRGLKADVSGQGILYELIDPSGAVVATRNVFQENGTATNDFTLAPDAPGGRWAVRATGATGEKDERPFVVASYSAPRIKKTLDFLREAYGAGERVEALIELEHGTGEPLANHPVRALLQVDGQTVLEQTLETDATGAVLVQGALPAKLTSGDGLLTVLVDEGGVTESISRSVPIVLADVELAFFPEGGDLVRGLPGRVYFEATDRHGEPADISGYVTDDRGGRVAEFSSVHDGLGRLAYTPIAGRTYTAHLTAPAGVTRTFALPAAVDEGCTLRAFDDVKGTLQATRVAVRCTSRQDVRVVGVLRDQPVDAASVRAGPDADAVVHLTPRDALAQGAMRVTVFDTDRAPLAERLIYRNHGKNLAIEITPDREVYGPRDEVVLAVRATDPSGKPLAAELALSVVDDAALSFADDEEGHALTRLYLEPELVESPDDPAWYFDADEAMAARGMDLVLGTKGWRRFDWVPVWAPARPVEELVSARVPRRPQPPMAPPMLPMAQPAMAAAAVMDAAPMGIAEPMPVFEMLQAAPVMMDDQAAGHDKTIMVGGLAKRVERRRPADRVMAAEEDLRALGYLGYVEAPAWAPVRAFPRPEVRPFDGVRSDFRDTVHWEPKVVTDANGRAEVRFHLSDAITSFRVTAEGVGGGFAGHEEHTLTSVLPVSVATRMPVAVTAGDVLSLPLTVTDRRADGGTVRTWASTESELVSLGRTEGSLKVAAGSSGTWWVPVTVGQGAGTAMFDLGAEGGGVSDRVQQALTVVPTGFPRTWSSAGESKGVTTLTFTVDDPTPGSLVATASWHPSTVSTLITGMEGMIREPGGCFEQTSSTNWPNVAILNYLEAHDGDPRLRAQSAQALERGYGLLTGYQVEAGGFETFGSGPGKEVLSAFGLLQFTDMKRVYPVDDAMLQRDVDYLLSVRDGKGGFFNSGESSHGYGAAPQPVLDGFITWSLVATGHHAVLGEELARQAEVARASKDPYVLALAARSLLAAKNPAGTTALERLAGMQAADGSFPGAESSITRSYEANLLVESTALAALALMDGGKNRTQADKAAAWITANRQGAGTWGATQATALALSALSAHAEVNTRPRGSGRVSVEVNGTSVGSLAYTPEAQGPLVIEGLADALVKGKNTVVLRHDGPEPLPYTLEVAWNAVTPSSAPGAELALTTALDRSTAAMGETVRLTARVKNATKAVVPSPIARIGLPAGLEAQTWQLDQLQERGVIAFYETRPREVTLYWEGARAGQTHEVVLDLLAAVPGTFTGPASSAYPYYDDDEKAWQAGLKVAVKAP